jgi:endonuclease/exonuclease/phosphatase family metal-dependent hydrolase
VGILICGDFNSQPESAVYELLDSGDISNDHPDLHQGNSK